MGVKPWSGAERTLRCLLPGDPAHSSAMHIFTDGSYLPSATTDRAGWAFAAFCQLHSGDWGLLGFGLALASTSPMTAMMLSALRWHLLKHGHYCFPPM